MPLTFPLSFPDDSFGLVEFDIKRFTTRNYMYGGLTQSREIADPRWMATFQIESYVATNSQDLVRLGAWEAFYDALQDAKQFYAYDRARAYPALYPEGKGLGIWSGLGSATAITASTITGKLSGFSNLQVKAGDHIGLEQGGKFSLHRAVEDRTASGSSFGPVQVEPFINTASFGAGAIMRFIRAPCVMIPVPDSRRAPKSISEASLSFQGMQILY